MQPESNLAVWESSFPMSEFTAPPDLSILNDERPRLPPIDLSYLGPLWTDWISATAEAAGCRVDYPAAALLTGAASLIGNARRVSPWQGWKEPCALWLGMIGRPSDNKSPGLDAVAGLLSALSAELMPSHEDALRSFEAMKAEAREKRELWEGEVKTAVKHGVSAPVMPTDAVEPEPPPEPRLVVGDSTVEALAALLKGNPKGLLVRRDELAGWLASFDRYAGGGDRQFWLEAFGGRPFQIDRVKHGKGGLRIPALLVSVLGGIQPDRLESLLLRNDDDGLPARFLWVWPERLPPAIPSKAPNNMIALNALRRLRDLQMTVNEYGERCPVVMPLSEGAIAAFQTWRVDHDAETGDAIGMLAGAYGKMPGLVLRLALILEHLRWATEGTQEPQEISAAALCFSCELINSYFKPIANGVFRGISRPKSDRDAATLASWIRKNRIRQFNAKEVRRTANLPGLKESAAMMSAIEVLKDAHWIIPTGTREGPTVGRAKADFSVNPEVHHG